MKIFLIGAGNSAKIILEELKEELDKVYVYDVDKSQIEKLKEFYNISYADIKDIANLDIDYVIEVASTKAVVEYGKFVIENNKNFIILSTGAFADRDFLNDFQEALKKSNSRVYVVSGAIGGIDLINAINDKIKSITLTTRKPPKSLGLEIDEEKVIFEGSSTEAIKRFPKNVNVAVTLSLAARDFDKVKVRIIADPKVERNIHNIKINSIAGNYEFTFENFPSENPKTSYLAPLSVAGLLKNINSKIKIGG
ncbi:aspartate dehydrogenase [Marinitoga piezophila KA3]|uniref:L-aspartate dehydrogenase n=1 Tax=Marinitoga piezophila (strain DSM 14283 / JCM 11233 / KA3) TaxID=443254 RepID=H2J308_MARPK|nr:MULTISPECIES: aspartate dehydrogenase [Marinitoga]AEX85699.1 aspartate dehydrogenase [Marinitoga piezophila KA3]NUU97814.1 hypothetical protein [Marinitoga sp. 1138]